MIERRKRYVRGSPQRRQSDLGWAAGVVDSEGTVRLHGGTAELKVDMIDRPSLERLSVLLGGRVRPNNSIYNKRQMHRWQLQGVHARAALTCLLPYLVEKSDQVALILTVNVNRPGVMLTDFQRRERRRVADAVSTLKKREYPVE